MSFKIINYFVAAFYTLVLCLINGCGQADGYGNSGTLNTYDFFYFGNFGSSTINSYFIKNDGSTSLLANTISTGASTSSVNDLTAAPSGKFLYSSNKSSNNISWYTIDSLSTATEGTVTFSSSASALGTGTSATKIHPNGNICFIANSTSVSNNISVCTIDKSSGAMTVRNDIFYTARVNPTNLVISPDGKFLFVVNRGTADVSVFSINSIAGNLTIVNLSTPTGTTPEDLVIHPTGKFLYTLSTGSNAIFMHSVSTGGALTALSPATISTGSNPKKIIVTANGKYIFVTNNTDNTISAYSVNITTGVLTAVPGSPFPGEINAGVYALAVSSSSKFLVVTGDLTAKAYIYKISSETGAISFTNSTLSLGANPRAVVVVPLTAVE